MPSTKAFTFPKTLPACADALHQARLERLDLEKQADEIRKREALLKDYLINNLAKGESAGVAGKVARVAVVTKQEPQVEDWDALYAYVSRNKAWDLLQRRLSAPAVRERWEANKEIKGVGAFTVVTLSITKV